MLLAGVALLASALPARCDDKKDDQSASLTQNNSDEQKSTDNSNASNNSTNDQAKPALPAPSNNAKSDSNTQQDQSNRQQDQSGSRDNDKSNRTQAEAQRSSADNESRSDQQDRRSNDRDRDRDSNRNQNERDVKAGIQVGRSSSRGVTVDRVPRGSIFYDSGLRDGDVIISYHGRRIRNRDDFNRIVVFEQGRIPVVVWRDGRERTIYVTYRDDTNRERSYLSGDRKRGAYFGAEFDPQITDAAIVVRVDEGSPADRAGLKRDDMVMSLNGKKVASGREANDMVASMKAGDRVEIEYSRHARTEAVLSGGRDQEVARRTSDDRVERSSYESSDSNDSRGYNSSRDSNYRDRSNSNSSQGRGIFGRRR
jgi:C-terminal processing protease CtpA/Prc